MKLSELPDDFTPEQFRQLDADALNKLPYTVHKLYCGLKNCNCGTNVRNYGIEPYYLLHRNSKSFLNNPFKYWWNLQQRFMICGKHWEFYNRLVKRFGEGVVQTKLIKEANVMSPVIKSVNQAIEKIEERV